MDTGGIVSHNEMDDGFGGFMPEYFHQDVYGTKQGLNLRSAYMCAMAYVNIHQALELYYTCFGIRHW